MIRLKVLPESAHFLHAILRQWKPHNQTCKSNILHENLLKWKTLAYVSIYCIATNA